MYPDLLKLEVYNFWAVWYFQDDITDGRFADGESVSGASGCAAFIV